MITATEVRKIALTSQDAINKWLDYFEKKIIALAEQNKREYTCYDLTEFSARCEVYETIPATPLQTAVMENLRKFGYTVKWDSYIDKAMHGWGADDSKEVSECKYYHVVVSW